MAIIRTFNTTDLKSLVRLSREFAQQVKPLIAAADNFIVVEIKGDRNAGKSLVADAMKAELLNRRTISPANDTIVSHTNGSIAKQPMTLTFLNLGGIAHENEMAIAMRGRTYAKGAIFTQNEYIYDISDYLPAPALTINVAFKNAAEKAEAAAMTTYRVLTVKERLITLKTPENTHNTVAGVFTAGPKVSGL